MPASDRDLRDGDGTRNCWYMPAHVARQASVGQLLLLVSAAAGYLGLAVKPSALSPQPSALVLQRMSRRRPGCD